LINAERADAGRCIVARRGKTTMVTDGRTGRRGEVERNQIFLTKHFTGMGADAWHGCSVYLLKRRGAVASGDGCGAVESQQAPG
jgi:hypothetical protein